MKIARVMEQQPIPTPADLLIRGQVRCPEKEAIDYIYEHFWHECCEACGSEDVETILRLYDRGVHRINTNTTAALMSLSPDFQVDKPVLSGYFTLAYKGLTRMVLKRVVNSAEIDRMNLFMTARKQFVGDPNSFVTEMDLVACTCQSLVVVMPMFPSTLAARPLFRATDGSSINNVLENVLSGLNYLHSNGFAHFDVKPENIALTEHGRCVLIDLGSASPLSTKDKWSFCFATIHFYVPFDLVKKELAYEVRPAHDFWMLAKTILSKSYLFPERHLVEELKTSDIVTILADSQGVFASLSGAIKLLGLLGSSQRGFQESQASFGTIDAANVTSDKGFGHDLKLPQIGKGYGLRL